MAATTPDEKKKREEGDESDERRENRTMGRKHIVPYGLYRAHGFVSAKLAERTGRLLSESDGFAVLIDDTRLGLEVAVINTLAHRLTRLLMARDPLSENVHLRPPVVAGLTLVGLLAGASRRLGRRFFVTARKPRGA